MKKIKIIFCITFLIITFFFSAMSLSSKKENSKLEGRNLTMFPDFELASFIDDDYRNQITEAFSDQLPFRNELIRLYFLFQFQKYSGDVVEGDYNQLFGSVMQVKDEYYNQLREVVTEINDTAQQVNDLGAKFMLVSIPRKDAVMKNYLPSSYISSEEIYHRQISILKESLIEDVVLIDGYDLFAGNDYYYTVDHHVNLRGSDLIFQEIMKIVKQDYPQTISIDLDQYYQISWVVVNGSFNRQIGQKIISEPEELFIAPKSLDFTFTRKDNGKLLDNAVSWANIWGNSDNTYANAFMNGDFAETVVETNRENLPNILYVGSSYLNALESLSVPAFNKMISIDYRHNTTGKSILDYVKEYDIDYVVFCPCQSTNPFGISNIKEHLGQK